MIDIDTTFQALHFRKTDKRLIKYIVVHYQGARASARSVAKYFARTFEKKSSHYIVDDRHIFQCVDESNIAYHIVSKAACQNSTAIGVDLIAKKIDWSRIKATDSDWFFDEKTWENGVDLISDIAMRYMISPSTHLVRHFDIQGKLCPSPFCGYDVKTYHRVTGNELWEKFKADVVSSIAKKMDEKYRRSK